MKRWLIAISVVGSSLFVTGSVQADVTEAKRLFKEAEEHFAASRYQEAVEKYEAAYKAKPLPGFHFNIGQCYQNLEQYEKAIYHFEQYIKLSKNPTHKADADRLIALCQGKLAEKKMDKMDTETPEQPPALEPEQPPASQPVEQPDEPDPRGLKRLSPWFFYSGIGVTAALLIGGSIAGGVALDKSKQFKDEATAYEELQDLKDSGESARKASNVCFGIAIGVGALTTAAFFFTDWGPKESSVAAAPLPEGGAVVTAAGRF